MGLLQVAADSVAVLPVTEGDEVRFFQRIGPTTATIDGRLPPGLVIVADSQLTDMSRIWRFRVVPGR